MRTEVTAKLFATKLREAMRAKMLKKKDPVASTKEASSIQAESIQRSNTIVRQNEINSIHSLEMPPKREL